MQKRNSLALACRSTGISPIPDFHCRNNFAMERFHNRK
jgi:hypothetical protein